MSDWKEKLQKLAESQGMKLEEPQSDQKKSAPRQKYVMTKNIRQDPNPDFSRAASAPYNFVPLSEYVVAGDESRTKRFDTFLPQEGAANDHELSGLTGYIELEIENVTPLFVRGFHKITEDETIKVGSFYSLNGKPALPGSSIRGMLRNLVEIISWSRLTGNFKIPSEKQKAARSNNEPEDFGRHLYFRALADRSNLRNAYQSRMSSFDKRNRSVQYKMSAGYLEKDGLDYKIIPAQQINGRQFNRISKYKAAELINEKGDKGKGLHKTYQFCAIENGVMVVATGDMPNKKNQWLINPKENAPSALPIPEQDVINYREDKNREAVNLIELLDKNKDLILPCFYSIWFDRNKRKRVAFGHTAMFRLPYQQGLHDLLPAEHADKAKPDFTEAFFGRIHGQNLIAGRVFVEDAFLQNSEEVTRQKDVSEILSTPKPTTFQHYLVQTSEFIRELLHYDSETNLRGHKLYWHRKRAWHKDRDLVFHKKDFVEFMEKYKIAVPQGVVSDYQNDKVQIKDFAALPKNSPFKDAIYRFILESKKAQYSVMEAVNPGARFQGKIRFENLSATELGALLSALQLPEDCLHKLGQGKPLGMGSIKITSRLFLSDRKTRYKELLSEWEGNLQEADEKQVANLKQKFEKFILKNIGKEGAGKAALWQTERLSELRAMLDWHNVEKENWLERTRYLEIEHTKFGNEYSSRRVLPTPRKVVD